MTFEQWWLEHGKDYWGAPYQAAKDAWEAARTVSLFDLDAITKLGERAALMAQVLDQNNRDMSATETI